MGWPMFTLCVKAVGRSGVRGSNWMWMPSFRPLLGSYTRTVIWAGDGS